MIVLKILAIVVTIVHCVIVNILKVCLRLVSCRSNRQPVESSIDQHKIAHLSYKLEASMHEGNAMKKICNSVRVESIEEDLVDAESLRLKNAVAAAKMGATSQFIETKYGVFECEANLIASVHGIPQLFNKRGSCIERKLAYVESGRLKSAIQAAKNGSSPREISEQYGLFVHEAELIVSAYSVQEQSGDNILH